MSKHSPSKKMKDKKEEKVKVQEEKADEEDEEEESLLEEEEEENKVKKMNQHVHQRGDTSEEEVEVKIREICNVFITINVTILSMNAR